MRDYIRILDLFSGAGGAAMGYHATFPNVEIVGVDIEPQPRYPFTFIQGDALDPPVDLNDFDLIHASPPCQEYSITRHSHNVEYPKLIEPVRELLTGHEYVIENVVGAPLATGPALDGRFGATVCGSMFGKRIHRHRIFETSFPLQSGWCNLKGRAINVYNGPQRKKWEETAKAEGFGSPTDLYRHEMEVDWMTQNEALEAIPPQYTAWIAEQWEQDEDNSRLPRKGQRTRRTDNATLGRTQPQT